jgi:ribulose-phosphate 3-epimerase
MIELRASIFGADIARLGEQIREAEDAGAAGVQVDIMDGHFVPNLSFGPDTVRCIRKWVRGLLEVDCMIENPESFIIPFAKAGADRIIIHCKSTAHLHKALKNARNEGLQTGVALIQGTDLSTIEDLLPLTDVIQVMTVLPGFGGQPFINDQLMVIRTLCQLLKKHRLAVQVSVDGGINRCTAGRAIEAGATELGAGTAIFDSADSVSNNVRSLIAADRERSHNET